MKAYIRREVDKIKKGLTLRIWNDYCTKLWDNIQFQPITQGFRIVGSASKMGAKYPVRAFRLGDKWTMQQLNDYIPDVKSMLEYKGNIDVVDVTPINQAKKLWPDWYQKRVVEGKKKIVGILNEIYMIGGFVKLLIKLKRVIDTLLL